jgi:hypothetical protein
VVTAAVATEEAQMATVVAPPVVAEAWWAMVGAAMAMAAMVMVVECLEVLAVWKAAALMAEAAAAVANIRPPPLRSCTHCPPVALSPRYAP